MIQILHGDCRDVLKTLADASVQMCVTSPPFFGLRDYGTAVWRGGDGQPCDHTRSVSADPKYQRGRQANGHSSAADKLSRRECVRCGAVREDAQIGLEQTPDAYVAELVAVFREVRRVLRDDGTLWLNLGDSYAGSWGAQGQRITESDDKSWHGSQIKNHPKRASGTGSIKQSGLKPKDLIGIPWMVAFALRADGWWLRSDIIWAKKNCMPESVTDRPSSAHEHVFLLTKSQRYFYDAEAIREEGVIPAGTRAAKGSNARSDLKDVNGRPPEYWEYTGTRNSRNVWSIATQPFAAAHFATFPPELAERCIKAGTSEAGCCVVCRAPMERQTEKVVTLTSGSGRSGIKPTGKGAGGTQTESGDYDVRMGPTVRSTTKGWQPTCSCAAGAPVPCQVLDPFSGAGTSLMVADRLGRDAIGIELSADYINIARRRLAKDAGMFAEITA